MIISNLKAFVRRIVTIIATTVILMEVLLRVASITNTRLGYYLSNWESRRMASYIDEQTGANLLRPSSTFMELNQDGRLVSFTSDKFGFRNNEEWRNQEIIVLGDSFTAGSGVAFEYRWSTILSSMIEKSIYNISANLSGPPQQLILLRRVVPSNKLPPIVIWMVYSGNDIEDSYRLIADHATKRDSARLLRKVGLVFYTGRVLIYGGRILNQRVNLRRSTGRRYVVQGKEMEFFLNERAIGYSQDQRWRDGWLAMTGAIADLASQMRSRNARLVVVYAPSKEEVFQDLLHASYGIRPDEIITFETGLLDWCREVDVECLSLAAEFRKEAKKGEITYFQYDGHWNSEGHRLASKLLCEYLAVP